MMLKQKVMKRFSVSMVLAAMFLSGCSGSSTDNSSPYPEISMTGESEGGISGANTGVSSLPRMEFSELLFFNSSKDRIQKISKPAEVVDITSVLMEDDKIVVRTTQDTMYYKIAFTDSREVVTELSYGWRFKVARTSDAFVDYTEICLYEEDKDGLPYFAFVDGNNQWCTWDIIRWDKMPKRKIMANRPTDEEVAVFQEKKLGEDFVGL